MYRVYPSHTAASDCPSQQLTAWQLSLIRNRTIAKCFSFYEKHNFDFTTIFCGTTLFFNALILNV